MKRYFKLIFTLLLIVPICYLSIGCIVNTNTNTNKINVITEYKEYVVGEKFSLNNSLKDTFVYYESSDESIIKISSLKGECLKVGSCIISAYIRINDQLVSEFIIKVVENAPTEISISGNNFMTIGDKQTLSININPSKVTENISFLSTDTNILTVSNDGFVTAVGSGLATIRCYNTIDNSIYDEVVIYVKESEIAVDRIVETIGETISTTTDISDSRNALGAIINKNKQYLVGILGYYKSVWSKNEEALKYSGTGVVYKRNYILSNGEEVEDSNNSTFKNYKYYVITNKHLVEKSSTVKVSFNNKELVCNVIAYDSKIDIAVVSFESTSYIPVAVFGDSDNVTTGEFVIAIGNAYGNKNELSASFGIVSYDVRYVSTDTDNDGTNDWDALYIQHDAPVSDGCSGGTLINLKGEIIGINSTKITADDVDNMAFAIPVNTVMNLVSSLEKGVVPVRPLLGVSIIMIKEMLSIDDYQDYYNVPSDINYGAYVGEVTANGVAYKAGVLVDDIILEFNGVTVVYSYEIRAALNEIIIGSGDEISIIVLRDGEIIELKAVF